MASPFGSEDGKTFPVCTPRDTGAKRDTKRQMTDIHPITTPRRGPWVPRREQRGRRRCQGIPRPGTRRHGATAKHRAHKRHMCVTTVRSAST